MRNPSFNLLQDPHGTGIVVRSLGHEVGDGGGFVVVDRLPPVVVAGDVAVCLLLDLLLDLVESGG